MKYGKWEECIPVCIGLSPFAVHPKLPHYSSTIPQYKIKSLKFGGKKNQQNYRTHRKMGLLPPRCSGVCHSFRGPRRALLPSPVRQVQQLSLICLGCLQLASEACLSLIFQCQIGVLIPQEQLVTIFPTHPPPGVCLQQGCQQD